MFFQGRTIGRYITISQEQVFLVLFNFSFEVQNLPKLRAGVGQFGWLDVFEKQTDLPDRFLLVQLLNKLPFFLGPDLGSVSRRRTPAIMKDEYREIALA